MPKDLEPIEHVFNTIAPRKSNFAASIPSMMGRFVAKLRVNEGLIQNFSFSHGVRQRVLSLPCIGVKLSFVC